MVIVGVICKQPSHQESLSGEEAECHRWPAENLQQSKCSWAGSKHWQVHQLISFSDITVNVATKTCVIQQQCHHAYSCLQEAEQTVGGVTYGEVPTRSWRLINGHLSQPTTISCQSESNSDAFVGFFCFPYHKQTIFQHLFKYYSNVISSKCRLAYFSKKKSWFYLCC